jgi:hypothetical protein
VVGLVADEGLPAAVAARLTDELPGVLTDQLSDRADWQVQARCDPLLLDENGLIPMLDLADEYKAAHDWDLLVLLTDLPRRAGTQPIVSDFNTSRGVGLVSMPALGALRLKCQTRDLVVHLIGHLVEEQLGLDPEPRRHSPHGRFTGRLGDLLALTRHILDELTAGRGPDACIDAVGMESHIDVGSLHAYDWAKQVVRAETDRPHALREAIMACANGGVISVIGVYGGFVDKLPIGPFMNRSLRMRTGQCHVHRYMAPLLQRIQAGQIDPSFVITHRMTLQDAPRGYQMFRDKQDDCKKIVLSP